MFGRGGQVEQQRKTALYWAPRALGMGTALFLAIFALDVFGEGYRLGELLIALFMHLIPSLLILVLLVISWRWERIGGFLYILLGVIYIIWFWHPARRLSSLIISSPLFLTGGLFLFHAWIDRSGRPQNL
jgi:hypothetical protein